MKCSFCGKEAVQNAVFCNKCGKKLDAIEQTSVLDPQQFTVNNSSPQETPPNLESVNESDSAQPVFIVEQQQETQQVQYDTLQPPPVTASPEQVILKKKSFRKKVIIFSFIAVFITIAIVAGIFVSSLFAGPLASISNAVNKTKNCKSFHFNVNVEADNDSFKLEGSIIFDLEERILELYVEGNAGNDGNMIILLKDNTLITDQGGNVHSNDIEDELDDFFDMYDEYYEATKEEEIDWEELFEELYIDDDSIDYDLFDEALKTFIINLNNPDYINEHLGTYSKDKIDGSIVHTFDINTEMLTDEFINVFGEALDIEDEDETSSTYNFSSELSNYASYYTSDYYVSTSTGSSLFSYLGENFEMKFITTSGYFSGFSFDCEEFYINATIDEFNDVEIDEAILEEYNDYL